MAIDRLQSKKGMFSVMPEATMASTGTASTVASLQYPGGFQVGDFGGFVPSGATSDGGGAHNVVPYPRGSVVSSVGDAAVLSHFNAGALIINITSSGQEHSLAPPTYAGQMLTLVNLATDATATCSLVTGVNTTGMGIGTTTAACQVLDIAQTLMNAGTATTFIQTGSAATDTVGNTYRNQNVAVLMGLPHLGGSATTNLPVVWTRIV